MKSALESLEEEDITVTFLRQAMIAIRGHLRESEVTSATTFSMSSGSTAITTFTITANFQTALAPAFA
jgi:hypothetical protein